MHIIVTGSAGFIGYHLTRRLLESGHHVLGVDSMTTGNHRNLKLLRTLPNFEFIEQDISRPLNISGPLDRIYNFACPASPIDFHDKAVEIMTTCSVGVRNLLDLALSKHALFLQASTSECYGDPPADRHPQVETYFGNVNPIGPRAPYDEGKRFAEAMITTYNRLHRLNTRIVRVFNTYGPHMRADDGRALPNFISQAMNNEPLTVHGDGTQTRSFCYVDDLVEAICRTADSYFIYPINRANDSEITIKEAAEAVIELSGSKSKLNFLDRPINDPDRRRPDLTRARDILGWSPKMPWREGFKRTIDYFRTVL
jgi:dTDP-glucose 4,6-dehydratase